MDFAVASFYSLVDCPGCVIDKLDSKIWHGGDIFHLSIDVLLKGSSKKPKLLLILLHLNRMIDSLIPLVAL